MGLIAIQDSLVVLFPTHLATPLTTRVSLPLHIHAKNNFGKKIV